MTTHSDKALKTISLMNTVASDWFIPEIEWTEVQMMVPGFVACPDCDGEKSVAKDADGKAIACPKTSWTDREAYRTLARAQAKLDTGSAWGSNCSRCVGRIGRYGHGPTGQVKGMVLRIVRVGKVLWPAGIQFDSRFSHADCQLCAKSITRPWRVPVAAKGADGRVHAMWVGSDCGRKFFGVEIKESVKAGGEIGALK